MKILWVSRHRPLPVQLAWLRRRFDDVEVEQDVDPFSNAEEIQRRFVQGRYEDMVVVAPLWVIAKLCELGIKPLWAEMQEIQSGDVHLDYRGRRYRFVRFRRIKAVTMEFEEV